MGKTVGLITDRPVPYGDDRLGHDEVAQELAGIALTVELPANIALYGRWGAGKSSIANSLGAIIEDADGAVWVRYDAFKWSGDAFHRHFLTQTAAQLDEPFDAEALYGQRSTNVLDFSLKDLGKTLGSSIAFLALLTVLLAVMFLAARLVADHVGPGTVQQLAEAVLVPVTLLGAVTLMVKSLLGASMDTLKVKRTVSAPSSDEQFENQFRALIRETVAKGNRVVVFVDELDRCSPPDVVKTLDAIRTFLDVDGCVCIVAADKHALEQALSVAVAQETPHDATNPYYSSGGAYLDKVFAYQVALPAPLSRRLTSMASDLAGSAGGVWNDVDDVDRIVSILVPTHVASPRRIKALLNAYAVAYRLMERKVVAGAVEGPPAAREDELAKLVCLQVEFPLFARELATDDRLPQTVLTLARERTTSTQLRREMTARKFLDADLDLDIDISRRARSQERAGADAGGGTDRDGEPPTEENVNEPVEAAPQPPAERDSELGDRRPASDEVRLVDQLVAYLRKTRHVTDPRPDLIHLEAMGSTHGLDPKLARELQDLAVDRSDELRRFVLDLDDDGRTAAVLMLADSIRGAVGVESENLIGSIFGMLAHLHGDTLGRVANRVTDALASELDRIEIEDPDRAGALALGVAATRPSRTRLLDDALADDDALRSPVLGSRVLEHLPDLLASGHEAPAARAFAARLTDPDTAKRATEAIAALTANDARRLSRAASSTVVSALQTQATQAENAEVDETAQAYRRTLEDSAVDSITMRNLAEPLLHLDTQQGRNQYDRLLPQLGRIQEQAHVDLLLRSAVRRKRQTAWLDAVDWTSDELDVEERLHDLTSTLWSRMTKEDPDRSGNAANLEAIARAFNQSSTPPAPPSLVPELADADAPTDEADARMLASSLVAAKRLVGAGLLERGALSDRLRPSVLDWISVQPPAPGNPQQTQGIRERLREHAPYLCPLVSFVSSEVEGGAEDVVSAINDTCVADDDVRARLLVHALAEDPSRTIDEVGPERIDEALTTHGPKAHDLVGDWIRLGLPSADTIRVALDGHDLLHGDRIGSIADALAEWSDRAPGVEVAALAAWTAADHTVADWAYTALQPEAADPERLADALVDAWQSATNNSSRRRVLDAWKWANRYLVDYRKTLIDKVFLDYLAVAADNKQAASWVASYAPLVDPPPYGTLTRLREALKPLISGSSGKGIRKAYEAVGILEPRKKAKKKRGLFGR